MNPARREPAGVLCFYPFVIGLALDHSRFAEQGEGEAPTGTLFEFRSALDARRSRQLPDLLVYRKTSPPPTVSLTDSVGFQRASQEFRKVEQFFNSTFLDQKEGVFTGSYHQFKDRLDFRPKLKQHLRILIQNQIRLASEEESPGATEWPWNIADRGSPFRGLQYFDLEHASVFFGRTEAATAVRRALGSQAAAGRAFVLVTGASGLGKSSLVRAGVLPRLTEPGSWKA